MCTFRLLYVLVLMITAGVTAHAATILNVRLLLEGPYLPETGTMRSGVVASEYWYRPEPFGLYILAWSIPDGATDWVYIEFRQEPESVPVARTACFLRCDGMVVDTAGQLPGFDEAQLPHGEYYIVVTTRNHCIVMSARPVSLTGYSACYDFSLAQDMAWNAGTQPMKKLCDSVYALRAGDLNRDGRKDPADLAQWMLDKLEPGNPHGDFNLDGTVDSLDSMLLMSDYPYTSCFPVVDNADAAVVTAEGFMSHTWEISQPWHTFNKYSAWCWPCRGDIIVEACTMSGEIVHEQVIKAPGGRIVFPPEVENGKYLVTLRDARGRQEHWTHEIELYRSPDTQ